MRRESNVDDAHIKRHRTCGQKVWHWFYRTNASDWIFLTLVGTITSALGFIIDMAAINLGERKLTF
jgi:hypothetical protein